MSPPTPLPAGGYPRAAAVAPRLQVTPQTGSTNADLVAASADAEAWPHLSVLLTTDQTAGRGRLERSWTAPRGAALAVSVLVRIPGIPPAARGWVPLAAGAAMTRAIGARLRGEGLSSELKWPNDVLVDGLKICGILAEVTPDPDAIVVGAGVNTSMAAEDLPVTTATSFAALGLDVDDDVLLAEYLTALEERLGSLAAAAGDAEKSGLLGEVERVCTTLGREVAVALPDGTTLAGVAERIDADGRLVVAGRPVAAGDVVHVR